MHRLTRKEFVFGLSACVGCRSRLWFDGPSGRGDSPSYWCTWCAQVAMAKSKGTRRETLFPGDQGLPDARDLIDERSLFGPGGWSTLYPAARKSLYLVLDDGWDVGYGLDPWGKGDMPKFGTHVLNEVRFPSMRGTAAERLKLLNDRIEDRGWRGAGIWVACQCQGDRKDGRKSDGLMREEIKRKLVESAEAGIGYWKVDWGVRDLDPEFRVLMSELRKSYHPELHIEHKPQYGQPLLPDDFERISDNPFNRAVLGTNDIFRTYDVLPPLDHVSTLARVAAYSRLIDSIGSRSLINVEDEVYIGAVLGHAFGVMRSEPDGATEVLRAVRWQEMAPAFGGYASLRTHVSKMSLVDECRYADDVWYSPARGRVMAQRAPAVIARGLELPDVRVPAGERPYVVAGRNPNGATAIGIVPRVTKTKEGQLLDVTLDYSAGSGAPLAVFGAVRSVSVGDDGAVGAVLAADLADGEWHDITAGVVRTNGRIVLDGTVLNRIGREKNPKGDTSSPGVKLIFCKG